MKLMAAPTGKLIGSSLYFVFRFSDYLLFLGWYFIKKGGLPSWRNALDVAFRHQMMIHCALNQGFNSTQLKGTLLLCIVGGTHFGTF